MFRTMRRIADLLGHPVEIDLQCACKRLVVVKPRWLLERLGPDATMEDGERRLMCKTCKQRPKLTATGDYSVTGGRDRRVGARPMPSWVDMS